MFDLQFGPWEHLRRQVYSITTTVYEDVCIALITVLEWPKEDSKKGKGAPLADALRTYLSTSMDCVRYDLGWVYAGQPIIDTGPTGEFDAGNVQTATEFLTRDGSHWLYYMGCPHNHETMNRPKGTQKSRIGLQRFRIAGLAYLEQRVASTPGIVTTKAFELPGTELYLNIGQVGNGKDSPGSVVVAVIDTGNGETLVESLPLSEDGIRLKVTWSAGLQALQSLVGSGRSIQLRFSIMGMGLYSFQWAGR